MVVPGQGNKIYHGATIKRIKEVGRPLWRSLILTSKLDQAAHGLVQWNGGSLQGLRFYSFSAT